MECQECGASVPIAEFNPSEGVTIVVSLPADAPRETYEVVAKSFKDYFPDHPLLIKPDDITVEEARERGESR